MSITDFIIEYLKEHKEDIDINFKNNKNGDFYHLLLNYGNKSIKDHQNGEFDDITISIERRKSNDE